MPEESAMIPGKAKRSALSAIGHALMHATIGNLFHAVSSIIRAISHGMSSIIHAIGRAIANTIHAIGRAIANTIHAIGRAIANTIHAIGRAIANTIHAIGRASANTIHAIDRASANTIHAIGRASGNTIHAIDRASANTIHAIGRAIRNSIHATFRGIRRSILGIAHGIAAGARGVARFVSAPFLWGYEALGKLEKSSRRVTLTLSMESGVARVVAFKGNDVIAWNLAKMDDPPAPQDEALDPENLDAEKEALPPWPERLMDGMPPGRLRLVTDLPLYSPLVRHMQLPKIRNRYAKQMILSEVLDSIPFDRDEVDVSWHLRRRDGGQEALAIAVPKSNMDAQVRLAKNTGLAPSAAYAKATALALVADADDAIVLHLDHAQLSTVLIESGISQVVHQQILPEEIDDIEEQANILARAVDQVVGYYHNISPKDESDTFQVVLTGKLCGNQELVEILPRVLGRGVRSATPNVAYPDEFLAHEYAANVGLFLADQTRNKAWGGGNGHTVPALNLLPNRHLPARPPVVPVATFVTLALLGAAAFFAGGWVQEQSAQADNLSALRDVARGEERELRIIVAAQSGTETKLQEEEALASDLEEGLELLQTEMDMLLARMKTITGHTVPFGVQLTSLVPKPESIALAGKADTYESVLQYAANLRESPLFEDASVKEASGTGESLGFTVTALIPQPETEEEAQARVQP